MSQTTQRTKILEAVRARLDTAYGPKTANSWLRSVKLGPWAPGSAVRPCLTVNDGGQRKAMNDGDAEDTKQYVLTIELILDLSANWERQADAEQWSDRIEQIWTHLQNWLPAQCCLRMDYASDDPMDVILTNGSTQSVWRIELECEYFKDVGSLAKG